jgi:hypothetical protein
MLIGIDESGDFSSERSSFYVSVFIRPKFQTEIEWLFNKWEKTIPKEFRDSGGEVKGYLLNEEQLTNFVEQVMFNQKTNIRYSCFGISTSKKNLEAAQFQKDLNIQQIKDAIIGYKNQGGEFVKTSNIYGNLLGWWQKLHLTNVIKIKLLGQIICDSLNFAIGWSAANDFDKELRCLQFKLDKCFIDNDTKQIFWKDVLRSQIWHYSVAKGGILDIAEWTEKHPFNTTFVGHDAEHAILKPEFSKRIGFYDSKRTFEVRVADIVASIMNRYINKEELSELFGIIRKLHSIEKPYILIEYSKKHPIVPSPYPPFEKG